MSDRSSLPGILVLWSAPRSRSTAFFRMMAERGDFTPVHEPFSYLAEFGYVDIDGDRVTSEPALIERLRSLAARKPVFIKDTTDERYPGVLADREFLTTDAVHTFLIRHPRDTIASYQKLNPNVVRHQIGFEAQYELFTQVEHVTGREPVVIDSDDLLDRPEAVVKSYCERVGIPFLPEAMSWEAGERREWAPSGRWHADAAKSTGFTRITEENDVDVEAHPVYGDYLRHHLPFYEMLHARRLAG
ncbi:branched chain amino acid aminotransferase [Actinoallomurus liliacearum]|uniref:Branched chain amino acid aminotransferase n=1 Tax=Actinoallomurus liliacearum TaxID=1080073 RepID=A0ABP8TH81_9ACTN